MTDPIDEELAALVAAEKGFAPAPPDELRARVLGAVEARIALLPPSGGGGDGGGGGGVDDGGARSSLARTMGAHPVAGLVGALLVGVTVGALGMRASTPTPPARVTYVERVVPGPSSTVLEILDVPPSPSVAPSPANAATARAPAPSVPVIDARGLAAERMLLDGARAALARGEPDAALLAVERHERTYPQGALAEEREALAVKALAAAARYTEARARGERFRERFPRSVSLGSVNATLASMPQ